MKNTRSILICTIVALPAIVIALAGTQLAIMGGGDTPKPPILSDAHAPQSHGIFLPDIIGKARAINIFAGFTRDVNTIAARLNNGMEQSTVLAPLNSELQKLPRKPWEDVPDQEPEHGQTDEQISTQSADLNLQRFVEAHIIPSSPWKEGVKIKSLRGEDMWWEMIDGQRVIQPQKIKVIKSAEAVGNGELWELAGCINYQ